MSVRAGLALALFANTGAFAQQLGAENILEAEVESVSRYAIEVILFTYGPSVTAGTEVFLPVEPPAPEINETFYGDFPDLATRDGVTNSGDIFASGDVDAELIAGGNAAVNETPEPAVAGLADENSGVDSPSTSEENPSGRVDGLEGNGDPSVPIFGDTVMDDELMPEIDLDQPLELIITDAASIEYTPLLDEERTLAAAHERLLRLDAYDPVLWAGWTQIVREQDESPSIDIRRLGSPPLSLEGDLTLYLGRFVHLIVDISLEERVEVADSNNGREGYSDSTFGGAGYPGSQFGRDAGFDQDPGRSVRKIVYRINDDRIMRNGDTRYFDHPKFGLIARLTLVEEPEPEATDPRFLPDLLPGSVDSPR